MKGGHTTGAAGGFIALLAHMSMYRRTTRLVAHLCRTGYIALLPSNVASDCPATYNDIMAKHLNLMCEQQAFQCHQFTDWLLFSPAKALEYGLRGISRDDGDSSLSLSTAQVTFDKGTGEKCCASWMLTGNPSFNFGYCEISCGRCGWVKLASPASFYRSAQIFCNPSTFCKPNLS